MAYKILLIDYDPRSIERIREVVAGLSAQIVVAPCGRSGLEEQRRIRPDLTLVQDLIPNVHGFDVCKEIKRGEDGEKHTVLLLCGPNTHSVLIDTGCDAYLKKPYGDCELLKIVTELLPDADASSTRRTELVDGARSPEGQAGSFEAEISAHLDAVLQLSA